MEKVLVKILEDAMKGNESSIVNVEGNNPINFIYIYGGDIDIQGISSSNQKNMVCSFINCEKIAEHLISQESLTVSNLNNSIFSIIKDMELANKVIVNFNFHGGIEEENNKHTFFLTGDESGCFMYSCDLVLPVLQYFNQLGKKVAITNIFSCHGGKVLREIEEIRKNGGYTDELHNINLITHTSENDLSIGRTQINISKFLISRNFNLDQELLSKKQLPIFLFVSSILLGEDKEISLYRDKIFTNNEISDFSFLKSDLVRFKLPSTYIKREELEDTLNGIIISLFKSQQDQDNLELPIFLAKRTNWQYDFVVNRFHDIVLSDNPNLEYLKDLLNDGNHNIKNSEGNGLLHMLAGCKNLTIDFNELIDSNFDLNIRNFDGDTPLIHAIVSNNARLVSALIRKSVNVTDLSNDLHPLDTAFFKYKKLAIQNNNSEDYKNQMQQSEQIIDILSNNLKNINDALLFPIKHKQINVLEKMLDKGLNPNLTTSEYSPLAITIANSCVEQNNNIKDQYDRRSTENNMAILLLKHNAILNKKESKEILEICFGKRNETIALLLDSSNFTYVNEEFNYQREDSTLLHKALKYNVQQLIDLLLSDKYKNILDVTTSGSNVASPFKVSIDNYNKEHNFNNKKILENLIKNESIGLNLKQKEYIHNKINKNKNIDINNLKNITDRHNYVFLPKFITQSSYKKNKPTVSTSTQTRNNDALPNTTTTSQNIRITNTNINTSTNNDNKEIGDDFMQNQNQEMYKNKGTSMIMNVDNTLSYKRLQNTFIIDKPTPIPSAKQNPVQLIKT